MYCKNKILNDSNNELSKANSVVKLKPIALKNSKNLYHQRNDSLHNCSTDKIIVI